MNDVRDVAFLLRLTSKEAEDLNRNVRMSGLSRESYVRQLISGFEPRAAPPADYYRMMGELHRIGNNLNQIAAKAHALGYIDAGRYRENFHMLCHAIETITHAVLLPGKIPDFPRKEP